MLRAISLASVFVVFGSVLFGHAVEPAAEKSPLKPEFSEQLLKISQEYESYGRVDDIVRRAPALCAAPSLPKPAAARVSGSGDLKTHGQKLYYLFAKDSREYLNYDPKGASPLAKVKNDVPHPVGTVIVKEAWIPEKVPADTPQTAIDNVANQAPNGPRPATFDKVMPFAKIGDDLFHAKEKASLFVMYKLAADTPDTDQGWVYGTVSADGKTVTSAGKVQSCMECHEKATRDRLFGMK